MAEVIIHSNNRDFADTLAYAVARELGVACEVAGGAGASIEVRGGTWPVSLPVRLNGVLADIEAALQAPTAGTSLEAGNWRLSLLHKTVARGAAEMALTDKETAVLQLLMERPGQVVDKETLLKTVWGMDSALDTHTLETHIYRLRNKFRELADDEVIMAEGGGYKLGL